MAGTPEEPKYPQIPKDAVTGEPHPPVSAPTTEVPSSSSPPSAVTAEEDTKKWGTHVMGHPAAPTEHPDNQKAAMWNAADQQQIYHHPYVQYSPVDKPSVNPFEPVIHMFNSWSNRAENIARNIWHNLKTGPSVSGAAWGKMNVTAKAISEGGFESLFKQTFPTEPNEKLKRSFACYLSTTTGPVAGTLYLSNARLAFCSDRPLYFTAPSGQQTWTYYRVMIPLGHISTVIPATMTQNSSERYIHITTADAHEFWFMGFVNFEKAIHHLLNSVSTYNAPPISA